MSNALAMIASVASLALAVNTSAALAADAHADYWSRWRTLPCDLQHPTSRLACSLIGGTSGLNVHPAHT